MIKALGWEKQPQSQEAQKKRLQPLTKKEKLLKGVLLNKNKRLLDELAKDLQWEISDTSAILLHLEMKGCVRALPGKYFEWI